jgi:hypothetical protein
MSLTLSAQVTIPDRVAAGKGAPIHIGHLAEEDPIPLEDLTLKADFVAEAKLIRLKSRLSDDRTTIVTDYQIFPNRVILNRAKVTLASPGQQNPLILTLVGGELVLDGTKVTVQDVKRNPWPEDAQMLVFLKKAKRSNQFEPYGENAGLFRILDGDRIEAVLKHRYAGLEMKDVSLENVIGRIHAIASRK